MSTVLLTAPVPRRPAGAPGHRARREAWLRALAMLLAVATYLNIWTSYALHGLTDYGRYEQRAPGEAVTEMGAEFRLVRLVQTTQLINTATDEVERPGVNAVWMVARIDLVRTSDEPDLFCDFTILGPQRRTWRPSSTFVSRDLPSSCPRDETPVGQPRALEVVFEVPERYVGDLAGVVVNDPVSRGARPVLVPGS